MEYCLTKKTLTIALAISLLSKVQTETFIGTHLEPSGTLYKAVGERLDSVCSYFKEDINDLSDNLYIQRCRNGRCVTLTSEIVNRTSIRTSIESLLVDDGQTYTCSFKLLPDTMSITYVRVGYRPSPPKDIYCFSRNHLDMNCTVTLADRDARSKLDNNITVYFQSTRSTKWLECPDFNNLYNYCYWKAPTTSGRDLDNVFVINRGYIILAKVMNVLGSNQARLQINDTSDIVTISRLHQFGVTDVTSRKAVLAWSLPDILLPVTFKIDFQINYTSKWDPGKQIKYSSKKQMRTVMKDLIPNTKYDVSIRARSQLVKDDRSWSSINTVSFKTKKDAPSAAPRYAVGGYLLSRSGVNNTGDNCVLQIYLKPVPRKLRNGDLADMDYRVTLEDEADTKYKVVDPVTTLTFIHKSCWREGPYRVEVQACIEGRLCSIKSSVIHIPSADEDRDNEIPRASEVIVERLGTTHFKVSWSTSPYVNERLIRQVTIFWCRGNRERHVCKRNLSWKIIKKYVTNADIKVKHSNYGDWIFAVSLTTHNGESGGMTFAECQFLYDKTQSQETTAVASLKPTFNLLPRDTEGNDKKSRDVISLTFRYCDVQFLYRKPEQYEIFYKKATPDKEENCIKGAHSFNVTATIRVHEIVLPELDPMSQYSVCMRIRTRVGTSELSDVRWRKPIKLPDGVNWGLVISLSVFGVLVFLVILAIVIRYCCMKYKKLDAAIEVPSVDICHQSQHDTSKPLYKRKASDEDSGFDSGEKKKTIQYFTDSPKLQSEESFCEIESQVSGNNRKSDFTSKRLIEPDSDCSSSEKKNCKTCLSTSNASNNTIHKSKNSYADCYWKAGDFHGKGSGEGFLEVDEKKPFKKPDEFGDQPSSQDANLRVILDRPCNSYKQQLDIGTILSVGDSENEASNYSDHSNSTLNSDLYQNDSDQIASLPVEDSHTETTIASHGDNSFTEEALNQLNRKYQDNYGNSQLHSNSDNPSERISLLNYHKPFAVSLETSDTNTNPISIEGNNSEEEHLLAYLQCDDKVEYSFSESDTDSSFPPCESCTMHQLMDESDTHRSMSQRTAHIKRSGCEALKPHSRQYCELDKHISDTYCEPLEENSSISCEPYSDNSATCHKQDKDIPDTCGEPHEEVYDTRCKQHKDYSGSGCEPHKHSFGSGRELHKHRTCSGCEQLKHHSDLGCEPYKDHSGPYCELNKYLSNSRNALQENILTTSCEPHNDYSDSDYESHENHCSIFCEPGNGLSDTYCEPLNDHRDTCSEPHREQTDISHQVNGNNSIGTFGRQILCKTLDDKTKTNAKNKGYVKKF